MCRMVRFWPKSKPKTAPLLPFPFYPFFFFSKAPKSINREAYLMYSQVEWRVKLVYTNCVRVYEHCLPKPMSYLVRNWDLSSGDIHTFSISSPKFPFTHFFSIPIFNSKICLVLLFAPWIQFGHLCLLSFPWFNSAPILAFIFTFNCVFPLALWKWTFTST